VTSWSNTYVGEAAAILVRAAGDISLPVAYMIAGVLCTEPGKYFTVFTQGSFAADGTVAEFLCRVSPGNVLLNVDTDPGALAVAQLALTRELALMQGA
jgi:hypothetical protein